MTQDAGRRMQAEGQNSTELSVLARQPFDASAMQAAVTWLREQEHIDGAAIARACARDWRLFHAVYDNLVLLEKSLAKHLPPPEAQRVWQRIELLQGEMDRAPKSLGWMIQQILYKPTQVPR